MDIMAVEVFMPDAVIFDQTGSSMQDKLLGDKKAALDRCLVLCNDRSVISSLAGPNSGINPVTFSLGRPEGKIRIGFLL